MKKLFLSYSILLCSMTLSQAQINQGTFFLGGSGSLNSNTENHAQPGIYAHQRFYLSYDINPQLGYFLSNNVAIGLDMGYNHVKSDYKYANNLQTNSNTRTHLFTVGPFVRYYHFFNEHIGLFAQGNVIYGGGRNNTVRVDSAQSHASVKSVTAGITPGIVFFVSRRFSLEATYGFLGYVYSKTTYDGLPNNESINNFSLDFNNFSFGVRYYFYKIKPRR